MKFFIFAFLTIWPMLGGDVWGQTTICQATQGSYGSFCSDQAPSRTANGGYNSLSAWVNIHKNLKQIAVTDNQIWGVDAGGVLWELRNFKASALTWVQVATDVKQISAGHNLLCQVHGDSHTYCTNLLIPAAEADASKNHTLQWSDTGATTYTQIAVSAGSLIWAVDVKHNLWQVPDYKNRTKTEVLVASGVKSVAVDGRGLLCETDMSNTVFCNNWPVPPSKAIDYGIYHSLSGWKRLGIKITSLAVADGKVYGTDPSGSVWLLQDYVNPDTWIKIANGGVNDVVAGASAPSTWTLSAFAPDEVAVIVFLGQSNATGINILPARFIAPRSPNVWGVTNGGWNFLPGNANGTMSFKEAISTIGPSSITWSNWVVQANGADMNLGFNTNASGSAANFAAYQWQGLINAGWKVPDLYEIHIGWASQGVDKSDSFEGPQAWVQHGVNLWQPLLTNTLMPSFALAPFSRRILNLALGNLITSGKMPRMIALQWNQWEAEADGGNTLSIRNAPTNYKTLFDGFTTAVGAQIPVQFVKPLSTAYGSTALSQMQTVFANLVGANPKYDSELDVSTVSSNPYSGGVLGGGDGSIHYNLDTQQWLAQQALGKCLTSANCGVRITSVPTWSIQ